MRRRNRARHPRHPSHPGLRTSHPGLGTSPRCPRTLRLAWPLPACIAALLLLAGSSSAQAPAVPATAPATTAATATAGRSGPDPEFLEQYTATLRFTLGTPQAIKVVPGGRSVLFLRSGPRSLVRDLYELDVPSAQERLLTSAARLLGGGDERLTPEEKARRERVRLTARGIASFDLPDDGGRVLVPLSGRLFVLERPTGAIHELPAAGGFPLDPRFSPDGARVACVRDGDLYVIDVAAGVQRRLTTGATPTSSHGLAEFVAQEEMDRREGYWWSPDSQTLAYEEADTSQVELFHIADPMHPERPADAWPYPRPGRANAVVRLGLVAAAGAARGAPLGNGGATRWVTWDRAAYPYLAAVRWRRGGPLTVLVQNREQTEERLLAVDPATGATRTLLVESDDAWLNIEPAVPRWLEDGSGFLWISERTGEARLELRGADGAPRRWLSPPGFGLRSLAGVDDASAAAYVVASADPTQEQLWRVPLGEAGGPEALTSEPGIHHAVFAHDGSAAVWSEATLSGERSWSVRRRDGSEAGRLRSVAERPPSFPRLELTTLGPLAWNAAIFRPRSFQPGGPHLPGGRSYPVLVSVYGGPHVQTVRRDPFGPYLLDQWIADHGYVVLTLDGRGTPGRGRAWERAIKGNLIDVSLADQVAGLQAAGARYPEMDLSRVGIFGWSFGGYFSAMAAMRRPDVYRAAVAGAPVCDWRDYDTHYTERYLGLPQANPEGYRRSSVETWCPDLRVPLLVVHGTADDNVYFMHSLKLTDALFRAGRPYDFLVLPGFTHMVPDAAVQRSLQERILAFFAEHLK
jgi:dipeptidyl-peptidase-4